MLAIRDLHQYYGGSHILRGVSIDARPGEITTLLGRNGVGKTTLLRCLMGLVAPRARHVEWNGARLDGLAPYERVARGFGYVPQGRDIFPRLSVEENLRVGAARAAQRRDSRRSSTSCSRSCKTMRARRGGDLSGGQQQQLAIGRALMSEPKLPDPRRADRGHPAVDHRGDRARDPSGWRRSRGSRSCWSSSTTTSRSGSPIATR